MSHINISDRLAERLNALMRPADGVSNYVVSAGILAAVTDAGSEDARIAALAYVFANQPFARWSGPPTPAIEYPAAPDFEGRDRAAFEALERNRQFAMQLIAFGTQVAADEVGVPERARRALAFLAKPAFTPMAKVAAFAMMLESGSPFLGRATPPRNMRFNEEIPKEDCHGILWRNRATFAKLNGIRESNEITVRVAVCAAFLAALFEIPDERERAVVLDHYLASRRSGTKVQALALELLSMDDLLAAISGIVQQTREAAENGEPCPRCGEAHKRGERHEQHE